MRPTTVTAEIGATDMQKLSRRRLTTGLAALGLVSAAGALPNIAGARQARPKVVVVGGGAAGSAAARYLASDTPDDTPDIVQDIDVTLIEPNRRYVTCFHSNLVLAGARSLDAITHDYAGLSAAHGVKMVHDAAAAIDHDARSVHLAGGGRVPYDALVVATGIDLRFDAIDGYDETAVERMPHAYRLGAETAPLKRQLEAMEDGGTFLLTAPASPYRCPAAPYERVSMVASYFSRHKPRSKILIVDAKDDFTMQDSFEQAWHRFYPDMIEWLPMVMTGGPAAVDPATLSVETDFESFAGDVVNVIPPQQAGRLARDAGLTDETGWCPVHLATLESALRPGIHVIGDGIAARPMPKSAGAANSQARHCAAVIRATLIGATPPPPDYHSACWSWTTPDRAIKVGARYAVADDHIVRADPFISDPEDDDATRARNGQEADAWYAGITAEMFG